MFVGEEKGHHGTAAGKKMPKQRVGSKRNMVTISF